MARAYRMVEFPSEGATLRGRLYLREDAARACPAVIMAHGFTATIPMVADRYAEVLYDAGFAVLLYDHRNFGISDGEPRQQANAWVQARGYRDAISWLARMPGIDAARIALWGDSFSGGQVIVVAALDARVKAIVAQTPSCGPEAPPADPDGSVFARIRETFESGDVSASPETTMGPLPVVSSDQHGSPSLLAPVSAYRWFIEYGGRHGSRWQNRATRVQPRTPGPWSPPVCARHLRAPAFFAIAPEDEMANANPKVARQAFDNAPGTKELREIDGGHFGLLHYPSALFDEVSAAQRDFLLRHL